MNRFALFLPCIVSLSPASWAQEAPAEQQALCPAAELSSPPSPVDPLFGQMLEAAQQISRLLSEVTDKESADRSAVLLEQKLAYMDEQLRTLENFSFRRAQDAEALKAHMATLTHISQSYLASMQRLVEVNAYGSETLLALFVRFKVDADKLPRLQAEDMPHTLLYNELADSLEDIALALQRVQDSESAAQNVPRLRELLRTTERTLHMLAQLVPPATDEQKEAVRPAREKLQTISQELKSAIDRLQKAQCYGNTELDTLLPLILQTTAA